MLRELNEKAPIITTPIAQLPGDKLLETMEHSKTLEEELLAEITCPGMWQDIMSRGRAAARPSP